jgi:hypothetical protein
LVQWQEGLIPSLSSWIQIQGDVKKKFRVNALFDNGEAHSCKNSALMCESFLEDI